MLFSILSLVICSFPFTQSQFDQALVSKFRCALFDQTRCCRALMVVECYEYCYPYLKDNCPQFIFEIPSTDTTTTPAPATTQDSVLVNQKQPKAPEQAAEFVLQEAQSQFIAPSPIQSAPVQPNIPQTPISNQIINQLSKELLGQSPNSLGNQANNLLSQLTKMLEAQAPPVSNLANQAALQAANQLNQQNTFFGTPIGNAPQPVALATAAPVTVQSVTNTVPHTVTYTTVRTRQVVQYANTTIQKVTSRCNSSSLRERPTNELCVDKNTANSLFQQCCRLHVPRQCWGLCHYETDDQVARQRLYVTTLYDGCDWQHLGSVLHCAAQNRDNRRCCQGLGLADNSLGVGNRCMRMCDVKGGAGLGTVTTQDRACLVNWNVLMYCHWHGIDY